MFQLRLLLASPTDLLLQLDFAENSLSTFFFLEAGRSTATADLTAQDAPVHLRLHQAHRRVRGELLSVMLSLFYSLPRCSRRCAMRRRARATVAALVDVELPPVHLQLF